MSDSLNKVLSKLVTSIEGVKNEREMLLRLIIGLAVFLLLAVFKKQISKAVVWLCTKTLVHLFLEDQVIAQALYAAVSLCGRLLSNQEIHCAPLSDKRRSGIINRTQSV